MLRRIAANAAAGLVPAIASLASIDARGAVEGEGTHKELRAVRTRTPPAIDGKLDEAAWASASPDDGFRQLAPAPGAPPTERTEVRVVYDDDAIYVGVRLFDHEPGKIVARTTRRDRDVETDYVIVSIDAHHDHATAEAFQLSAAGVHVDWLNHDDFQQSNEWDAVWDGATSIDGAGWTAEFRIPLAALRFSSAKIQTWGFEIYRHVSRKGEDSVWAWWPPEVRGLVSRFGHLVGLEGLRPRRTFELRPFLVGRWRGQSESGTTFLGDLHGETSRVDGDVGLDLKLGLASNFTLDATVNPDFGQIEADQVVLNLSRFETFYPEKRPFFLEGIDVFQMPVQLFYSRRIGRAPSGIGEGAALTDPAGAVVTVTEAPGLLRIPTAAKVSGRVGSRLNAGALGALTGAEDVAAVGAGGEERSVRLAPRRFFGILRGRVPIGGGASYLGGMATAVDRLGSSLYLASADHDAYVQSLDGQWQRGDGVWRVWGQSIASQRVGGPARRTADGRACPDESDPACRPITRSDGTVTRPGDVGWGGTLGASRIGQHWIVNANSRVFSPTLDVNDAGFLTDFNKLQGNLGIGWREVQPSAHVQQWSVIANLQAASDFSGVPLFIRPGANGFLLTRSLWLLSANAGFSLPWQWDTNETTDGARTQRPNGTIAGFEVRSDSRRAVIGSAGFFGFKDFYGGAYMASGRAGLTFQGFPRWEMAVEGSASYTGHHHRFYDCTDEAARRCDVESRMRHYRFGLLDSGSLSLTARTTYAFTSTLTLQGYAQLYMAQGSWRQYSEVDTTGTHPFIRLRDLRPSGYGGDTDGDGIKDDGFQDTTLKLNAVLRWEYQPGATLMMVYTRAQSSAFDPAGVTPRFRPTGLSTGPTEDVLLLKLSLLWS